MSGEPEGAVWSGSTLFAILSASFRHIRQKKNIWEFQLRKKLGMVGQHKILFYQIIL